MKKKLAGFLAALMLCAGSTTAFAAAPERGRNFTDTDGDGICDCAVVSCLCGLRQRGGGNCGARFTDADGDGICDNREDCPGAGTGSGCRIRGNWVNTGCGANRR